MDRTVGKQEIRPASGMFAAKIVQATIGIANRIVMLQDSTGL